MKDYYALLGIPKFIATPDEIRRAYLEQVRFFHPDTGHVPPEIAHEKTLLLNQAYDTLKDPTKKRQYDLKLLDALGFSGKKESAQQGSPPKTERPSSETNTTPPHSKAQEKQEKKSAPKKYTGVKITAALFVAFLLVGFLYAFSNSDSKSDVSPSVPSILIAPSPAQAFSSKPTPTPTPAITPAPVPRSGAVLHHDSRERIAPLTIKTSGTGYYLVKLKDSSTGADVISVFVHGGDTVDIDVPLGSFELVYASGNTWYGEKNLFGKTTSCTKAKDIFTFYDDGQYVNGWTVTLYAVYDGNLETVSIDVDDF